jgi:hypothetical protein
MKKNAVFQKVPAFSAIMQGGIKNDSKEKIDNIPIAIEHPKYHMQKAQSKEPAPSLKIAPAVANSTTNPSKGGIKGTVMSVPRGVVPLPKKITSQPNQPAQTGKTPVVQINVQKQPIPPPKVAVQPSKKSESHESLAKRSTTPTKH